MNAIYMPPDPRYQAFREAILGGIDEVLQARRRDDLQGQLQAFMNTLTGNNAPSQDPAALMQPQPGAEALAPGASPDMSGITPAAPQQPAGILDALNNIKDPNLLMNLLPTALNYDLQSRTKDDPAVKMEFSRTDDKGNIKKRTYNVRMSQQKALEDAMSAQGWEPGEIIPPKMTLKENGKTKTYWAISEDGRTKLDTGIQYDKESPETWSQWEDPATKQKYNVSSRGKMEPINIPGAAPEKPPSTKEAADKIADIDKAIYKLQTEGALDNPIMAVLAAQNPGLVDKLKGDPKEAIKTLEAQRSYLLKYAPPEVVKRYNTPKTPAAVNQSKAGPTRMVWDAKLKKAVPTKTAP